MVGESTTDSAAPPPIAPPTRAKQQTLGLPQVIASSKVSYKYDIILHYNTIPVG